jgi:hypothetical protein
MGLRTILEHLGGLAAVSDAFGTIAINLRRLGSVDGASSIRTPGLCRLQEGRGSLPRKGSVEWQGYPNIQYEVAARFACERQSASRLPAWIIVMGPTDLSAPAADRGGSDSRSRRVAA